MMFDVRFVGLSRIPYKLYIECRAWFVNTSLWLIYVNLQPAKTGDSQNQKGIGGRPDSFGVGTYNLQSISALLRNRVWFMRLMAVSARTIAGKNGIAAL